MSTITQSEAKWLADSGVGDLGAAIRASEAGSPYAGPRGIIERYLRAETGTSQWVVVHSMVGGDNRRHVHSRHDCLRAALRAARGSNLVVVTDRAIGDDDAWVWGDIAHTLIMPDGRMARLPA